MRRIGLIGGTFDPVHNGHLLCATQARARLGLHQIVFIPAGTPWQKPDASPAEGRFRMVCLATGEHDGFSVSRVEIDRRGPTYTLDTLKEFVAAYPDDELYFITGLDAVSQILTWRSPDEVLEMAKFVAIARPGVDAGMLDDRVERIDIEGLDVSSSEIRRRAGAGEDFSSMVHPAVADYIQSAGLYR